MCIVIDTNTLAPVFNQSNEEHDEFRPVKDWISRRQGYLVFGGTRYRQELKKTYRYMRLVRQMKDSGHAVEIRDEPADTNEVAVIQKTSGTDCDDQHIIALLGTSRCPLLCSRDIRSYEFVTKKSLYPKGMPKVRIYSSGKNRDLLRPTRREALKNQA